MSIYSLERNYTYCFIVITTLFTSVVGQLPGFSFFFNTVLLLVGLFILFLKVWKQYSYPGSNVSVLLFAFLLFSVLCIHQIVFTDIKFFFLTCLQFFILGSGYKYLNRDVLLNTLQSYFKVFVYWISFFSLAGLFLYFAGIGFTYGELEYIRFSDGAFVGLCLNPNTVGYVSLMAVAFIWLLRATGYSNRILWFCFFINLLALLLCKSRASFGALGIFFFFYVALQLKPKYKFWAFALILLVVVLLILYGDTLIGWVSLIFNKAQDNALNGRDLLWLEGIAALQDYYLWGTGYSNFNSVMLARNPNLEYIGLIGGGLHNFYLQTAVMLGIVVLLFYIGLLTVVLRVKLRKADKSMYRLLIGMKSFIWAVVFLAFFEVHMMYAANVLNTFFWIFTGILLLTKSKHGESIIYHHSLL